MHLATAVLACNWFGEAKVGKLDIEFIVKHDIFQLEVPVGKALTTNMGHCIEQLAENGTANSLIEGPKLYVVK